VLNKIIYRLRPAYLLNDLNRNIISEIKRIKPKVTLVFKGMELFPATLEEIKKHTSFLCNYNPDHPYKFYSRGTGNSFVLDGIKFYDLYFSYAKSVCTGLTNSFGVQSYCVPFGFDETLSPTIFQGENIKDKFIFVGAWDKERESIFTKLTSFPVQIYGPKTWVSRNKEISRNLYSGYAVYDKEYYDATFSAKGVFNFLRPQNIVEQSHNMRTFEIPGCGGLMITNRTKEQSYFFEENKEAVYFDSIDELKDKIKFYHHNDSLVSTIKKNAFSRSINSGYSYLNRSRELSDAIRKNL
jgi:spore maturation protein CgeB